MLTEAQNLYLIEVLGTWPESYLRAAASANPVNEVFVLSPKLSLTEGQLLERILASAKLSEAARCELEPDSSWRLPEGVEAHHILVFSDEVTAGRSERDGAVWWGLGSLAAMLGEGPEIAEAKKKVWIHLQQINKERHSS